MDFVKLLERKPDAGAPGPIRYFVSNMGNDFFKTHVANAEGDGSQGG